MSQDFYQGAHVPGGSMNPSAAQVQPALSEPMLSPQSQGRLLHLAGQLDQMQARLDQLADDVHDTSAQLDALLRTLLTPHGGPAGGEQLAELAAQVEATHERVEQMQGALAAAATQEQIESLVRILAGRELVTELADSVKKLGRTQFKANMLGETREQQIESALSLARELITHREQVHDRRAVDERLRLDELRKTARGELAADLLPALDSIDLALAAGQELVARQQQRLAAARTRYAVAQQGAVAETPSQNERPMGLWDRLRRSLAPETPGTHAPPAALPAALPAAPPPAPPVELDLASELTEAATSWLSGLQLVRERFAALLALEEVQPLPALGQPFDPRLHLAIEAETRGDVPANTVVRVLRQGYRQRQRVLRYAEVVVARPPISNEAEPEPV